LARPYLSTCSSFSPSCPILRLFRLAFFSFFFFVKGQRGLLKRKLQGIFMKTKENLKKKIEICNIAVSVDGKEEQF
jgi:hypothetical protein